jgi:protein phosphatase
MKTIKKTILWTIPDPALVLLLGIPGSGKSSFARKHFKDYEIISSDELRYRLTGDIANQSVNAEVFAIMEQMVGVKLRLQKTCVVDATNVKPVFRHMFLELAEEFSVPAFAIVLNLPLKNCLAQNRQRKVGRVPAAVISKKFFPVFRKYLPSLKREGFASILELRSPEERDRIQIRR